MNFRVLVASNRAAEAQELWSRCDLRLFSFLLVAHHKLCAHRVCVIRFGRRHLQFPHAFYVHRDARQQRLTQYLRQSHGSAE